MTITYKDKYKIELGEYSYDLYTRSIRDKDLVKDGQIVSAKGDFTEWRQSGYFIRVPFAVEEIIRHEMRAKEDVVSLKEFIAEYKAIRDDVLGMLSEQEGGVK